MSDRNESTTWEVVTATPYDRGDPSDGAQESSIAHASEDEARRVFADTIADAAERGYEYVRLRRGGVDVEYWPQRTGWTV